MSKLPVVILSEAKDFKLWQRIVNSANWRLALPGMT
jgi:hypothetical protein